MAKLKTILFLLLAAVIAFYSFVYILVLFLLILGYFTLRVFWFRLKERMNNNNGDGFRSQKNKDPQNTIIDVDYEVIEEDQLSDSEDDKKNS